MNYVVYPGQGEIPCIFETTIHQPIEQNGTNHSLQTKDVVAFTQPDVKQVHRNENC